MSYSFTIRGASKAMALASVSLKLDEIAIQQPVHAADNAQAMQAAELFVGVLPDDDTRDVQVSMNGYVSGQWEGSSLLKLTSASVSVTAGLVERAS